MGNGRAELFAGLVDSGSECQLFVPLRTFPLLQDPLLFGGVWAGWVYKGLAILLIGCPCALVISTPAAIAASLSAGARRECHLGGGIDAI